MDRALDAGSPQRWAEINTRFHLAIAKLAGMPMLEEMMQRIVDHWDRVRRFYFRDVLIHRTRLAQAEHRAIVEHMEARDLPALEQTIRDHNQRRAGRLHRPSRATTDGEKRERPA